MSLEPNETHHKDSESAKAHHQKQMVQKHSGDSEACCAFVILRSEKQYPLQA